MLPIPWQPGVGQWGTEELRNDVACSTSCEAKEIKNEWMSISCRYYKSLQNDVSKFLQ